MTDRDSIREQKREELREQLAGDGGQEAAATPDEPIHVEGADHFQSVLADNRVVLVDFYADWCGPCKMLEPVVADIAAETDAAVAKVDVDAHQALAGEWNVSGVPTLYVFESGESVEHVVGARDGNQLRQLVERHL